MSEFQYDDILNYQYPNPEIEKDFPDKILRAAQFAPFAALTGHEEAICETARLTENSPDLSDNDVEILDVKLQQLRERVRDNIRIKITHFVPDKRKDGGAYETYDGVIRKFDMDRRRIIFLDNKEVLIDMIVDIESEIFNDIIK